MYYSIKNYADFEDFAKETALILQKYSSKKLSPDQVISVRVTSEVYDKIVRHMWNVGLTYTDLRHYAEVSMTIDDIRFQVKIK
jgi:hypothetical protein